MWRFIFRPAIKRPINRWHKIKIEFQQNPSDWIESTTVFDGAFDIVNCGNKRTINFKLKIAHFWFLRIETHSASIDCAIKWRLMANEAIQRIFVFVSLCFSMSEFDEDFSLNRTDIRGRNIRSRAHDIQRSKNRIRIYQNQRDEGKKNWFIFWFEKINPKPYKKKFHHINSISNVREWVWVQTQCQMSCSVQAVSHSGLRISRCRLERERTPYGMQPWNKSNRLCCYGFWLWCGDEHV